MATSSSSIASKLKSPTSSTSPSTNGYLNSPLSPTPRIPPPPLTQESGTMDITLTLLLITPLDIQFNTPSPLPSFYGHPIPWNLLEAHGDSLSHLAKVETRECDIMIYIAQDTKSYHIRFTKI
ncbi:hypothetical protein Tco_0917812 [Tanacetum coccineum]